MYFHFGTRKIIDAAGVLFNLESCRRMAYLRLLKLLYIADRESLSETGRPIIGTRPVAMDFGPVHSEVYNLIKGVHPDEAVWKQFYHKDGYNIQLVGEPGVLSLSPYEVVKLEEVSARYRDISDFDLVEITHEFPEWVDNHHQPKTSVTIPMEHILKAIGRLDDAAEILRDAEKSRAIGRVLFGS